MTSENKKEAISWILYIAFAFVFAFFINTFVIVNANVPTGSMLETIPLDTKLVAFRPTYMFSEPQRKDIIVFKAPDTLPENDPSLSPNSKPDLYVKRLIGLENETLEIRDGLVYINNSEIPLDEPYLRDLPKGNFGPIEIPDNHYFMLGDNRDNSADSRAWKFDKFVSKDEMLGKVIFSYFPKVKIIK